MPTGRGATSSLPTVNLLRIDVEGYAKLPLPAALTTVSSSEVAEVLHIMSTMCSSVLFTTRMIGSIFEA